MTRVPSRVADVERVSTGTLIEVVAGLNAAHAHPIKLARLFEALTSDLTIGVELAGTDRAPSDNRDKHS